MSGIRTNLLARVLAEHHCLREGHPDMGCGDVGCAYVIAREYRKLERRYPKRQRVTVTVSASHVTQTTEVRP